MGLPSVRSIDLPERYADGRRIWTQNCPVLHESTVTGCFERMVRGKSPEGHAGALGRQERQPAPRQGEAQGCEAPQHRLDRTQSTGTAGRQGRRGPDHEGLAARPRRQLPEDPARGDLR